MQILPKKLFLRVSRNACVPHVCNGQFIFHQTKLLIIYNVCIAQMFSFLLNVYISFCFKTYVGFCIQKYFHYAEIVFLKGILFFCCCSNAVEANDIKDLLLLQCFHFKRLWSYGCWTLITVHASGKCMPSGPMYIAVSFSGPIQSCC